METYPGPVSKQCSKIILEQMDNSIYTINENEQNPEIGFFCYIKYKKYKKPVLISSSKAINPDYLKNNTSINVKMNNKTTIVEIGKIKIIKETYDLSIIEIKENKNNQIKFLDVDEKLYELYPEADYVRDSIYIIHNNGDKNVYTSYGMVNDVNDSKIFFSCNINSKSKNSPIFNLNNNKLIGVYKENSKYFNEGIFFKFIINTFINEFKRLEHNNIYKTTWNEIDILINIEDNKKDINNNKIYFLYNYHDIESSEKENNNDNNKNLKEFKKLNPELHIDNVQKEFQNFYVFENEGQHNIKIKFNKQLTDTSYMFAGCENIISINFIRFKSSKIKNMKYMFYNCKNLRNANLLLLDTNEVTDMSYMFFNCQNLINLDLSSFDTKKVTDITYMFEKCDNLENLYLTSFEHSNVAKKINKSQLLNDFHVLNKYEILSPDYSEYDYNFKVIILGNELSGKRLLINEALYDGVTNLNTSTTTFGFNLHSFFLRYKEEIIKLEIWDFPGHEIYSNLNNVFYRKASLAIILYSIDDKNYKDSIKKLLKQCKNFCGSDIKYVLVGNKIDIDEEE